MDGMAGESRHGVSCGCQEPSLPLNPNKGVLTDFIHCAGSPGIDVVFVHGIRGGPFASWRTGSCPEGTSLESCTRKYCWPTEWLSPDLPSARLLSLEYAAPASGWEVGSSGL